MLTQLIHRFLEKGVLLKVLYFRKKFYPELFRTGERFAVESSFVGGTAEELVRVLHLLRVHMKNFLSVKFFQLHNCFFFFYYYFI